MKSGFPLLGCQRWLGVALFGAFLIAGCSKSDTEQTQLPGGAAGTLLPAERAAARPREGDTPVLAPSQPADDAAEARTARLATPRNASQASDATVVASGQVKSGHSEAAVPSKW